MSTAFDPEDSGAGVRRIAPAGVTGLAAAALLAVAVFTPIEPLA